VYHGIETPDARLAAKKSEEGHITVSMRTDESNLVVTYRDDGSGIDAKKIGQRAVENGFITQEAFDALTEREKILLIFNQGFSTAENPGDIAGSGLSVVKEKIQELGGKLSLKSRLRVGCEFTLTIPQK
jgi:two-component system chemotaxis sensor kinase CheA